MNVQEWKKINAAAGIAPSDTYDMSLEISRKVRKDEPEFSNAEKEHIQDLLVEWYAERIRKFGDSELAREAVDMGVIL